MLTLVFGVIAANLVERALEWLPLCYRKARMVGFCITARPKVTTRDRLGYRLKEFPLPSSRPTWVQE